MDQEERLIMEREEKWDLARQVANLVGAIFQVGVTAAAGAAIQGAVDEGPASLIEPAGYAFSIWALIFILSLGYAVYLAMPSRREDPLLRRIGPFTAGAFFCTGMWSVFVALGQFLLAQAMLLARRLPATRSFRARGCDRCGPLAPRPATRPVFRLDHRGKRRQPHL